MTMLQLLIALLLATDLALGSRPLKSTSTPTLCETIVLGYGYPCQEYTVTTEDGFVLGLQRIPYGKNSSKNSSNRVPVLLQHGLLQGAEVWVVNSPLESLGFILADEGYDVWFGNTRGSKASQGNIYFSNQDPEYWNWSFEELAIYDLVSMLELIYNTTESRPHFIGHSQGTTIAFVGLTQSKVTSLLSSVVLLSPVAFVNNITPPFTILLAHTYLEKFLASVGSNEFNPDTGVGAEVVREACKLQGIDCSTVLQVVMGDNSYINKTRFPDYLQFLPQSTSTKNMGHFAQLVRSGTFSRYDYGNPIENMKYYNQTTPPAYDFSTYPRDFPLLMVTGGKDGLADVPDVQRLLPNLGNCKVTHIFKPESGHADFLVGTQAYTDVYVDVNNFFKSIPK